MHYRKARKDREGSREGTGDTESPRGREEEIAGKGGGENLPPPLSPLFGPGDISSLCPRPHTHRLTCVLFGTGVSMSRVSLTVTTAQSITALSASTLSVNSRRLLAFPRKAQTVNPRTRGREPCGAAL